MSTTTALPPCMETETCRRCGGDGSTKAGFCGARQCPKCKGTGLVRIDYRKPPLPDGFNDRHHGICRFCGEPTYEPRRRYWHKACVEEYLFITNPEHAKLTLIRERGRRCEKCGRDTYPELDHIVPLALAPRELKYWQRQNLQLLCHKCHVAKTTEDMRQINEAKQVGPTTESLFKE
ncbi:HNH endonuclease [bacterium]|nr:HNH endonuclease [bacterium]